MFSLLHNLQILTAFWGLLRGGHEAPSAPRYIPTAKYQILVPFQNYSSENGVLSLIHSAGELQPFLFSQAAARSVSYLMN